MTNDERLKERREGAALAMEAMARDTRAAGQAYELDEYDFLDIARDYRAGRWDGALNNGMNKGDKDAG